MKVVKKTGLVPVYSLQTGAVTGMKPDLVRALLKANKVELVAIPDGIETYEVADIIAPPPAEVSAPPEIVDIPEGWERQHFLKQIKLAQTIAGYTDPPEGRAPKEYAIEVLRNEVQRRAAAETPPA